MRPGTAPYLDRTTGPACLPRNAPACRGYRPVRHGVDRAEEPNRGTAIGNWGTEGRVSTPYGEKGDTRSVCSTPLFDLGVAWKRLREHAWPGNIRQLRATIRRVVLLATPGKEVGQAELQLDAGSAPSQGESPGRGDFHRNAKPLVHKVFQKRTSILNNPGVSLGSDYEPTHASACFSTALGSSSLTAQSQPSGSAGRLLPSPYSDASSSVTSASC